MDESADFQLELGIETGTGYSPAQERQNDTQNIGHISIDAIFTPIKNVAYTVENTLVGKRVDYEKIVMTITTDGSIAPKEALQSAAIRLVDHFSLLVHKDILLDRKDIPEEPVIDQKALFMKKKLLKPLRDLGFSVRAFNCLKSNGVKNLGDITKLTFPKLMQFRNFGKISLAEVEELLEREGLSLGMDLSNYQLKEEETL